MTVSKSKQWLIKMSDFFSIWQVEPAMGGNAPEPSAEMWSRGNVPLLIMSAVSAAILCFFAFSGSAALPAPRELYGCGWSEQPVPGPIWPRAGNFPKESWNPAFPPSPPHQFL